MKETILLVEDESMLREAFTIVLNVNGYEVDSASNGVEALELCKNKQYDLILLDLMMPIMDGVGFLAHANLPINAPETRIVILSNLSSGLLIDEAMSLGVHRREVKANLSTEQLVDMVKDELKQRSKAGRKPAGKSGKKLQKKS